MLNELLTYGFRRLGSAPCFRIYGKARPDPDWRTIDVFATHRRDADSRWPGPFWRGTCITWTSQVIAIGWDFAEQVLREQLAEPASRDHPVAVVGGRIRDATCRTTAGGPCHVRASEILAHECGHTQQAQRLGILYLPVVGAFTLFREGPHWWNHFENQASADGLFGGFVSGSICEELMIQVTAR
jgi:hypothetical protein